MPLGLIYQSSEGGKGVCTVRVCVSSSRSARRSPVKCKVRSWHAQFAFRDAHKTPWKVECTEGREHETDNRGQGWKAEVEVILTHSYGNKNM